MQERDHCDGGVRGMTLDGQVARTLPTHLVLFRYPCRMVLVLAQIAA